MEIVEEGVKKRFLHWVRAAQRLPVDMSAQDYFDEMVRQVLAPRLSEGSEDGDGARHGGSSSTESSNKPMDDEGLRKFVAQHNEEFQAPGSRTTKRLYRSLEQFLSVPRAFEQKGETPPAAVVVMGDELRAALAGFLAKKQQMTPVEAAACVTGVDAVLKEVLEKAGELVEEEVVATADQLAATILHHWEPLTAKLSEEHQDLSWCIPHLRSFATTMSDGGDRPVLDDRLRAQISAWLVRHKHVQDASSAGAVVEQVEDLLRPYLRRTEKCIGVERAREVVTARARGEEIQGSKEVRTPPFTYLRAFLGISPSHADAAAKSKRRSIASEDAAKHNTISAELRAQFLSFLVARRKLADVTSVVVAADFERMIDWIRRKLQEGGKADTLKLPVPDQQNAQRMMQEHHELCTDYVAMRRKEGRQSSVLPHVQAFLGLPPIVVRGTKRPRADSIIAPVLRAELINWMQSVKKLSIKCTKNYCGELSAMLKHLVQVAMPEQDVHGMLLDKEGVKDILTRFRTPHLEQVMEERHKAGRLREASVNWLQLFLGIKEDSNGKGGSSAGEESSSRSSGSRRALMPETGDGAGGDEDEVPEEEEQQEEGEVGGDRQQQAEGEAEQEDEDEDGHVSGAPKKAKMTV